MVASGHLIHVGVGCEGAPPRTEPRWTRSQAAVRRGPGTEPPLRRRWTQGPRRRACRAGRRFARIPGRAGVSDRVPLAGGACRPADCVVAARHRI